VVAGKYCQVCGQENIAPKESAWHLITHFFYDITHFDGRFFNTVKYLLLKPGFLTAEYTRGRRMSYLHPVRMYVFTSAFFFLIYFSFINEHSDHAKEQISSLKEQLVLKEDQAKRLYLLKVANAKDTVMAAAIGRALSDYETDIAQLQKKVAAASVPETNSRQIDKVYTDIKGGSAILNAIIDSVREESKKEAQSHMADSALHAGTPDSLPGGIIINDRDLLDFNVYKYQDAYMAVQRQLPQDRRDGIIERSVKLRLLRIQMEKPEEREKLLDDLFERFKHSFPKLLFVSLPFFAFFLWLLYFRRKEFYYADHGIFTVHIYCAIFIFILLSYFLEAIRDASGWSIFSWLKTGLIVYGVYFVYKAMRNFYGQGRYKTLAKYIALSGMTSVVMTILVIIFLIISAYNI
jgi:hypothetical protein